MPAVNWEHTLRATCGLDPQRPVVAGVSGGPDSLCLLDILHKAGYAVVVAHFNHRLRPEADREAADVADRARALGLPFESDSADVRAWAGGNGLSVEEAARTLRYRFLFAAARTHHAQAVAVGHTADDQAETVLMHFLRGAGLAGLKGMEARGLLPVFDAGIPLVRPLLCLWRSDVEAYCRLHALEPHLDASNLDETYFRNRLRRTLIPELERYNPRFKETLLRTAAALQGDHAVLSEAVEAAWGEVAAGRGAGWLRFDRGRLARLAPGLRRNLLRRAVELLRPAGRDLGFEALERGASFAGEPGRGRADLAGGLYLFAEGDRLYLAAYEADLPFGSWPQVGQPLALRAGGLELGEGWVLTAEEADLQAAGDGMPGDDWSVWLDARAAAGGLTVRPRRQGDRFQPLGMEQGSVKLSDLFVNAKLPRRARAGWPLVCAGERIAWVPGMRIGHPFRVTDGTLRVLKLELRKK